MRDDNLYEPLIGIEDNEIKDFSIFFTDDSLGNIPSAYYKKLFPSVDPLIKMLRSDSETGISTENAESLAWRRETYGDNYYEHSTNINFIDYLSYFANDYLVLLLVFCSCINIIIGYFGNPLGWYEGIDVINLISLVVLISAYFAYKRDLKFEENKEIVKSKYSTVIRDGKNQVINTNQLLVGDILILKPGDIIPTIDGVIISGEVKVSEGKLRSNLKHNLLMKKENDLIFSSTKIYEGYGKMIICTVGLTSFVEKNAKYSPIESTQSILIPKFERQINKLSQILGNAGFIGSIIIFFSLVSKDIIYKVLRNSPVFDLNFLYILFNSFVISLSILLIFLPQGLPNIFKIATSYSISGMKKDGALIKSPSKVEMLGHINEIVTDFIGIISKGKFELKEIFMNNFLIKPNEEGNLLLDSLNEEDKELLCECMSSSITNIIDSNNIIIGGGKKMDQCFFDFLTENKYTDFFAKGLYVLPFKTSYHYTISIFEKDNKYELFFKGSFPSTIGFIDKVYLNSKYVQYKGENVKIINDQVEKFSDNGYDTVIIGKKEINPQEMLEMLKKYPQKDKAMFDSLAVNSTLICIIGTFDPLREKVDDAILGCQRSGLNLRIFTGRSINIALGNAMNCDIISMEEYSEGLQDIKKVKEFVDNYGLNENNLDCVDDIEAIPSPICITGKYLTLLSGGMVKEENKESKKDFLSRHLRNPERFMKVIKNLKIIAEANYKDKLLLVVGLHQMGKIVGVTSKKLLEENFFKYSNLGISLGISGHEITKESSDLILLDDSFISLYNAIKYGRGIIYNIKKYIQFSIIVNIVTISVLLLGIILLEDSPLGAGEIIWLVLVVDTLASIALVTEKPDKIISKKLSKKNQLISSFMKLNIMLQSIYQIAFLFFILLYSDQVLGISNDWSLPHFKWNKNHGYQFTIFFTVFVYFQVFNSINCRKINKRQRNVFEGITSHLQFVFYEIIIIAMHLILVTFGGSGLRLKRLTHLQHIVCFLCASSSLLIDYLVKILTRKRKIKKKNIKNKELKDLIETNKTNEDTLLLIDNLLEKEPQKYLSVGELLKHNK